jgi:protoporphyrinogen oxidase
MNSEKSSNNRIFIIGAGYTGLSAAYDLARAGYDVEVFESDEAIGGLAGSFEVSPGVRLEKFYHHWFSSDKEILGLLDDMGLSSQVEFHASTTGLFYANSIFRLASPLDLLRFKPLPFIDRIRTGLMALYARRIAEWRPLEKVSAKDWICRIAGRRSFEVIWGPLLGGKFGVEAENVSAVWFWNKLKLRGSSRDEKGSEQLLYFRGGFDALSESIRSTLEENGVVFHMNTAVQKILSESGKLSGIMVDGEMRPVDNLLVTTPLPSFFALADDLPAEYVEKHSAIRFLGNVCLVLRLDRSLSDTYWLNVADPSFPFVGVIEHTNLDSIDNYNGEHIAYISKYLPTSEALFSLSDEELLDYCIPFLQRIFPQFERSWVIGHAVWRAEYSQPVITKNYSQLIPGEQTPIDGVWLSTMAQIYPEDRGTNYAVRHGRAIARDIVSKVSGDGRDA